MYLHYSNELSLQEKLNILADAAKYDIACTSSGSRRKGKKGYLGNSVAAGVCHSFSGDGRCISLLKILLSNDCIYDCKYCQSRCSNSQTRATFSPKEICTLVMEFYKRNYIEGLFLSSAVCKNPIYTMERMYETISLLRNRYHFNGYIHMKGIPGTDESLIRELGQYVDRLSVNIELPSSAGLRLLAPQKTKQSILLPMRTVHTGIMERQEERKKSRKVPSFVPAGQTTQLIIGATPDSDRTILRLSESLYHHVRLKRVYYSAYVPMLHGPGLPELVKPPLLREHRLYQADWLLRFYQFTADEILSDDMPDFDLHLDPKACWALRHPDVFPVEINRASYHMLLRVPGIGVQSARRICAARQQAWLSYDSLRRLGIVLKRAKYFITCRGRYYGGRTSQAAIRQRLLQEAGSSPYEEVDLFSGGNT